MTTEAPIVKDEHGLGWPRRGPYRSNSTCDCGWVGPERKAQETNLVLIADHEAHKAACASRA